MGYTQRQEVDVDQALLDVARGLRCYCSVLSSEVAGSNPFKMSQDFKIPKLRASFMVKNGDQKVALISGIAGQDGSFLAELLVNKGYSVHGLIKQGKIEKKGYLWRLSEVVEDVKLHQADLNSEQAMEYLFEEIKPDEVYHLASDVSPYVNFDTEISSFNLNFIAAQTRRAIKNKT